jgi:hypothetical protein
MILRISKDSLVNPDHIVAVTALSRPKPFKLKYYCMGGATVVTEHDTEEERDAAMERFRFAAR